MSRRDLFFVIVAITVIVGVGCAAGKGGPIDATAVGLPAKAPPLVNGPVVAVQGVDAPGFNVDDLTARLRDSLVHTSGVIVVDVLRVRAEIAACIEFPCAETEQERFKNATLVAVATVSRVGPTLLGSVRIQRGIHEVVRVNAQGSDAAGLMQELGFLAGRQLRIVLTSVLPTTESAPSEER